MELRGRSPDLPDFSLQIFVKQQPNTQCHEMGELRDKLPAERFPASLRPCRAVRPATNSGSASDETDLSLEIVSATANGSQSWPKSPAQAGTIPKWALLATHPSQGWACERPDTPTTQLPKKMSRLIPRSANQGITLHCLHESNS